jgi:hypothetical protein
VVTGSMRNRLRQQGIEALRGAYDGGSQAWHGCAETPPPRVFPKKRLQMIENKRRDSEKDGKEAATVGESKGVSLAS